MFIAGELLSSKAASSEMLNISRDAKKEEDTRWLL